MESLLHRLIFNASCGCLMAVAEVVWFCGKAAGGEGGSVAGGLGSGSAGSVFGAIRVPNRLLALVDIVQTAIKIVATAAALVCAGIGGAAWAQALPATTVVGKTYTQTGSDVLATAQTPGAGNIDCHVHLSATPPPLVSPPFFARLTAYPAAERRELQSFRCRAAQVLRNSPHQRAIAPVPCGQ